MLFGKMISTINPGTCHQISYADFFSWEMETDSFQWLTFGSKSSCNAMSVHEQKEGVRCQESLQSF